MYSIVKLFDSTNTILLTFLEKKKLSILETENVCSHFKTNQNILKILSCIENYNINNQ